MTKTTIDVWPMTEGGYAVVGTDDKATAMRALVRWLLHEGYDDLGETAPHVRSLYFDGPYRLRKNPCICGEEHAWDLGHARAKGHGARIGFEAWS